MKLSISVASAIFAVAAAALWYWASQARSGTNKVPGISADYVAIRDKRGVFDVIETMRISGIRNSIAASAAAIAAAFQAIATFLPDPGP